MRKANLHNAAFYKSYYASDKFQTPPAPEIVICGKSNVGKSSMINKLLNRNSIARVSSTPGKTVSINLYDIDGLFYLTDLPGYGFARGAKQDMQKWRGLIDAYFKKNQNIKGILFLVDIRHPLTEDDKLMYSFILGQEIPFLMVATKSDKLSAKQVDEKLEYLSQTYECTVSSFSSKNGDGRDDVWDIIYEMLENDNA